MGAVTPGDAKECDAPVDTLGPKVESAFDIVPEVWTPANNCCGGGTAPYTFEEKTLPQKYI